METGFALLAVFVLIAGLTALLYYMGLMTLNSKTAALFLINGKYDFSMIHGKIKSCNGTVKRVLRFKKDEPLTLKLESELVYGTLAINIKDFSGDCNVTVGAGSGDTAEFVPKVGKPYFLTFTYKNADGEFWFYIKNSNELKSEEEVSELCTVASAEQIQKEDGAENG